MSRNRCDICDNMMAYGGDYCPSCSLPDHDHDPHAPTGGAIAWTVLALLIFAAALLAVCI